MCAYKKQEITGPDEQLDLFTAGSVTEDRIAIFALNLLPGIPSSIRY